MPETDLNYTNIYWHIRFRIIEFILCLAEIVLGILLLLLTIEIKLLISLPILVFSSAFALICLYTLVLPINFVHISWIVFSTLGMVVFFGTSGMMYIIVKLGFVPHLFLATFATTILTAITFLLDIIFALRCINITRLIAKGRVSIQKFCPQCAQDSKLCKHYGSESRSRRSQPIAVEMPLESGAKSTIDIPETSLSSDKLQRSLSTDTQQEKRSSIVLQPRLSKDIVQQTESSNIIQLRRSSNITQDTISEDIIVQGRSRSITQEREIPIMKERLSIEIPEDELSIQISEENINNKMSTEIIRNSKGILKKQMSKDFTEEVKMSELCSYCQKLRVQDRFVCDPNVCLQTYLIPKGIQVTMLPEDETTTSVKTIKCDDEICKSVKKDSYVQTPNVEKQLKSKVKMLRSSQVGPAVPISQKSKIPTRGTMLTNKKVRRISTERPNADDENTRTYERVQITAASQIPFTVQHQSIENITDNEIQEIKPKETLKKIDRLVQVPSQTRTKGCLCKAKTSDKLIQTSGKDTEKFPCIILVKDCKSSSKSELPPGLTDSSVRRNISSVPVFKFNYSSETSSIPQTNYEDTKIITKSMIYSTTETGYSNQQNTSTTSCCCKCSPSQIKCMYCYQKQLLEEQNFLSCQPYANSPRRDGLDDEDRMKPHPSSKYQTSPKK